MSNKDMKPLGKGKIALIIILLFIGLCWLMGSHAVLSIIFYLAAFYFIFGKGFEGKSAKRKPEAEPPEAKYDPAEHGAPMECPFCGKEVPSDVNFCFYCGKPLESFKRIDAARKMWLYQLDEALDNIKNGSGTKASLNSAAKIRDLTDKILTKYAKDPEDRDDYDRFIEYYLPKTAAAVEQYGILCTLEDLDSEQINAKKQLAESIDLLDDAFTNIYNRISTEGLFDISTDITALENILKLEGLAESDFKLQARP